MGTSLVISGQVRAHTARFPYVFIRDNDEGTLAQITPAIEPEGRHFSREDGCWLTRYSCKAMADGEYVAESSHHVAKQPRKIHVRLLVKDGSVERVL